MTRPLRYVAMTVALCALPAACGGIDTQVLCEDFENEPAEQAVSITIRNNGDVPIFLTGSGCSSEIDLLLTNSEDVPLVWRNDGCDITCEDMRGGPLACDLACAVPPVIYVAPGGSYQETWSGIIREQRNLPASCMGVDEDADTTTTQTCSQKVVAADGHYHITAQAFDLVEGCENASCTCEPNVDGSCAVEGFGIAPMGGAREASATFKYPSAGSVDIAFD